MAKLLVIAHHLCWTGYGHWLPNDPRGSGSTIVRCDWLRELGDVHYGRKKVQPRGSIVEEFYERAEPALRHPTLVFAKEQIEAIGESFGRVIAENNYTCYACAIMPDHVHLVIRKHKHQAEEMIAALQEASRQALTGAGFGSAYHPIWTDGGWKVFLFRPNEVRTRIGYVERNPTKEGLPEQHWDFVKVYDGWPLHPGHSPNSPYARALRGQ